MNLNKKNHVRLCVSIDKDTLYYLKKRATKNKRTISAEADWILSYFLDVDRRKQKEWKNLTKQEPKEQTQEEEEWESVKDLQEMYTWEEALEKYTEIVGEANAHALLDPHKKGFKK